MLPAPHNEMLDSGMARVGFRFEISDLNTGDTISFLPSRESLMDEGPLFKVQDPASRRVLYRLRSGKWVEAEIMEFGLGGSGPLRFRFRESTRTAWQYSEFSPVSVAHIERTSVTRADIKELERLGIFTPEL